MECDLIVYRSKNDYIGSESLFALHNYLHFLRSVAISDVYIFSCSTIGVSRGHFKRKSNSAFKLADSC